jgi:uncharacterized protein YjbI with pentapeptide repeats
LASVAAFSCLVATVPGERLDVLTRPAFRGGGGGETENAAAAYGFAVPFLDIAPHGKLLGLFERNLRVTDLDLVSDKDVTPGEPTLNLRRRDLRYARLDRTDLHQADLTGANLDGASLVGADLRGVFLHCADVGILLLTESRRAATCPSARGADFSKARLGESSLSGLDLGGAQLEEADLGGAKLAHANMAGANLYSARLERADLTGGIAMQGANLATAALQGADLAGAKLQAADLTSASLQGAVLDFASLDAAVLRDADLEGASLFRARLPAASLAGASIRAASLREAWVWRTVPPDPGQSELADLAGLRTDPPTKTDASELDVMLKRMTDARLEARVRDAVADILGAPDGRPSVERGTAFVGNAAWADVARASLQSAPEQRAGELASGQSSLVRAAAVAASGGDSAGNQGPTAPAAASPPAGPLRGNDRRSLLTRHLAALACKPRWANGSVATGLSLRALGPAFNGDVGGFYEGLRRADCAAGRLVPAALMSRLANAMESAHGK